MNLRAYERTVLLDIARSLTGRGDDPAAVAGNALVLAEWAGQAISRADLRVRMATLQQQCMARNTALHRLSRPRRDPLDACADNPCEFLRQAQVLYSFAIADAAPSGSWA